MRLVMGGLLIVTVLAGAVGCGEPEAGPPSPSPSPTSAVPPSPTPSASPASPSAARKHVVLTVTRTGGFAGVEHLLQVVEDRTWTYTGDGQRHTGRLTGPQMDTLKALATDSRLPAEAKYKDKRICHDGYTYDVTVGSFSITAVECGQFEERPALTKLVEFLKDTTAL